MNQPISPGPNHLLYPPGGLLIWSLVVMELLTFGVALIAFLYSRNAEPAVFAASCAKLKPAYGIINTVFLLTSGYFMALSLEKFKTGKEALSRRFLLLAILGGASFLLLKGIEYSEKISQGLVLSYDTFFTYYWLLTTFHVLHVLVGLVILLSFLMSLRKSNPSKPVLLENYEAGATFWHMCDLIWLILFPVIYLLV